MSINRKVGETISVRVPVRQAGSALAITGGTAKARLRGRSTQRVIDATITLTEATGLIDADFAAATYADTYDFQCFLTLNGSEQCVAAQTFNITESVYQ